MSLFRIWSDYEVSNGAGEVVGHCMVDDEGFAVVDFIDGAAPSDAMFRIYMSDQAIDTELPFRQ